MIKLTNRQQFNTLCILSNHGNDIKTYKTQVEHRAAGKVKNGVRSFRYIWMSACGEVVKFSARNVYSGEEQGEPDVFAGYVIRL